MMDIQTAKQLLESEGYTVKKNRTELFCISCRGIALTSDQVRELAGQITNVFDVMYKQNAILPQYSDRINQTVGLIVHFNS